MPRYNPILIGGDLFTVGYLTFQGIQSLMPSIRKIAAVGTATLICGIIAGAINIGVGIVSLVEAMQAFRNNDKRLSFRLFLDFVCCIGIGAIMMIASLAIQVSVLAGIGAFFAANPWFLSVLFFAASIPLILELGDRLKQIYTSSDLGTHLQLNQLRELLSTEHPNWEKIDALCSNPKHPFHLKGISDSKELPQLLSNKMEEFQAEVGVTAATAAFELLIQIQQRNQKEALEKLEITKKRITEWNHSLYLRMFQQFLYLIGFGISMGTFSPTINANLLNATIDFFFVGANVIPLGMDTGWPFKRNTPIVVPKVVFDE